MRPTDVADRELCCAIAAGRLGVHPDGWGNHDPLPLRWLTRRDPPQPYTGVVERPDDAAWKAEHRRRPVEEPVKRPKRPKRPAWVVDAAPRRAGELELTCDSCCARYGGTLSYYDGKREESVEAIRKLGAVTGWTCIVGRDICPNAHNLPRQRA